MRRAGRKGVALIGAMTAAMLLVSACSSSTNSGTSSGDQVTLKVRLFGTFGYKEAGLFTKYESQHPNIKIDYTTVEQEATYWTALQTSLSSGAGLGDVQGIEVGRIAAVTSKLSDKFADLNTLGATSLKDNFYSWKWQESMAGNKQLGLGTDVGPLAICYRTDLFKTAGLPTDPAQVSALWANGWDGYVAAGQKYKAGAPANSYWTDTAGGMFNAVIGQSANQYYDASGKLIVSTNPAVKSAWDTSMKVAAGGLSAKLSQFSTGWNVAFTTGTFATIACPSWMVGYIKSEAGDGRPVEHRQHPGRRRQLGWLVPGHPDREQAPEGSLRPDLLADRRGAGSGHLQGSRQLPVEQGRRGGPDGGLGDRHVLQWRFAGPGQAGRCSHRKDLR